MLFKDSAFFFETLDDELSSTKLEAELLRCLLELFFLEDHPLDEFYSRLHDANNYLILDFIIVPRGPALMVFFIALFVGWFITENSVNILCLHKYVKIL